MWLQADGSNKGKRDVVAKQAVMLYANGDVKVTVLSTHASHDKQAAGAAIETEASLTKELGPHWPLLVRGGTTDKANAATKELSILLKKAKVTSDNASDADKKQYMYHRGLRDPTRIFNMTGWVPEEATNTCLMHAIAALTHDVVLLLLGSTSMKDNAGTHPRFCHVHITQPHDITTLFLMTQLGDIT